MSREREGYAGDLAPKAMWPAPVLILLREVATREFTHL
jgi:hypothetical protein